MRKITKKYSYICLVFLLLVSPAFFIKAQIDITTENLDSNKNTQMYISPRTGSFTTGSILDVSVYLDTKNTSVNAVDLKIKFDPKKLAVAKPSGGKSIFGIWLESPTYDNNTGLIAMSGVIPEGINTSAGLITTISFRVISSGETSIKINENTSVYLNDGLGTKSNVKFSNSSFTFKNPISEGVNVFSETHPFSDNWYNNNNPILSWENIKPSNGYSVLLDSNPLTNPDNNISTTKNTASFNSLKDGIWYFHIKSKEGESWSNVSNYKLKIDTNSPDKFKPVISKLTSSDRNEYLLMFNASDVLSGIDHYEVGLLKSNRDKNTLPVFVQAESPYILPTDGKDNLKIIVKAYDSAGNVREAYTVLYPDKTIWYLMGLGTLILLIFLLHYLLGHHVAANIKKAYLYFKNLPKNRDSSQV